jgi:hypothetical protein
MYAGILEQSFQTAIEWIFTVDSQESKKYIETIHSTNPSLSRRDIAQKIVDEQSLNNGLFGAVTGMGTAITLPIALPLDIIKGWRIQSFMIRCLAEVYGYTPQNTDLKTAIFLLISNGSIEELKRFVETEAAIFFNENALKTVDSLKQTATRLAAKEGSKFATKALTEALCQALGKKVAQKIIQKSFGTVALGAMGAVIGGGLDWMTTQGIGRLAIEYFENSTPEYISSLVPRPVEIAIG